MDHWIAVAALLIGGLLSLPVLFVVADQYPDQTHVAGLFYGSVATTSIAVAIGIRCATRTRWWWLIAATASPLSILALYTFLINVGVLPIPF